jgi:hypothetical protein
LNPHGFTDDGNARSGFNSGSPGRILVVAHEHLRQ